MGRTVTGRRGGRRSALTVDEIVRVGRGLGMRRLSVKAVAQELGVSSTALYRHVDGRWGLERMVGESFLAGLELPDDPAEDLHRHLRSFASRLREFTLGHSGMASYLQVLFPRGEEGRRLLEAEVAALERRGYAPDAAVVLSGAVASLAISLAASEESDVLARSRDGNVEGQRRSVRKSLLADARLGPAHAGLPEVTTAEFTQMLLAAAIRGLVEVAPPGRPVSEIVAELSAVGGER